MLNAILFRFRYMYVMPSTSPRAGLYPRSQDKVLFFMGLKKLYDHVKYDRELDVDEIRFEPKRKIPKRTP